MKLSEIKREEVLAGKCWLLEAGGDEKDPNVRESIGFTGEDVGLFSAVVKIADGTEHLAVVVKSFPAGGDDIDIFMWTKFGWMNIHSDGFMRALGKYSHDLFPFDYFLANPWKGGRQPEPDKASSHSKIFRDTAVRIKQMPGEKSKKA
jgi:hypothetical protein